MEILLLWAAIIASLCASAFFSGSETGLLSVSRERILHLVRKGGRRARMVQHLISDMGRTTTTILIGNNIANVSYSTATAATIHALTSDPFINSAASLLSACIVLIFGEFIPKLLFSARPLRRTLMIVPVFQAVSAMLRPLSWLAMKATHALMSHTQGEQKTTAAEIMGILRDRRDGVCLTDFEHALITKLLAQRTEGTTFTKESIYAALDALDATRSNPAEPSDL